MSIAALITFLIAAVGGFVLLGIWLAHGGTRPAAATAASAGSSAVAGSHGDSAGGVATKAPAGAATAPTKLPPGAVFLHFLVAVVALVLWIIYLAADSTAVAWATFIVLIPVALVGIGLLLRWRASGCPRHRSSADTRPTRPESHFPVSVVLGHGVFAVATVVLVLLAALNV